ncbi:glycosyltransferase [Paenibacillus provencensis]|uniref:Glycosyl-4,4'-diaponeurosporenoate acyltransferase n=1 Tax=Paenibacillus provencensis TaxID=441151 RepID=A0ABW3PU66_9BACL|nr:glycosyltransferase [Paenibacillus sp. MER 78]MCM3126981.1 glycosyltransferase [Paenibacillus sp. MER 78]
MIPARNEERNIGRLLKSLQEQVNPTDEIIVVDDESTDRTAEIAAKRGARIVNAGPLPAPLFFLWNTPIVGMMILYALAANLPCIFSLRYNRARILCLLDRRSEPLPSDSVIQIDPGA